MGLPDEKLKGRNKNVKDAAIFKCYLRMADSMVVSEVEGYNLFRWLSSIGGLTTTLIAISSIIVKVLSRPLFMYEIMNSLFMVSKDPNLDGDERGESKSSGEEDKKKDEEVEVEEEKSEDIEQQKSEPQLLRSSM